MDRRKLALAVADHQSGRFREAEASYRAMLRKSPRDPEILNFLGTLCLQTGRSQDAVDLIGKSLRISPRDAGANDNMGSALAALGRHGDAANYHRRALRLDSHYAPAYFNLGNALQQDNAAAAAEAFRRSVLLRPEHTQGWYNLGNALRHSGRPLDAARAFRRALELDPGMVEAKSNLADALATLGHDMVSLVLYREVVAAAPQSADAHYNLGVLAQKQGQLAESETAYRSAVELAPHHALAWNNLGDLLITLKRPQEAEQAFRTALAHRPEFTEALHNLGGQLYDAGRIQEAREHKEAALRQSPAQDATRYDLALIQLTDGDIGDGWDGYRLRFAAAAAIPNRQIPLPAWDGSRGADHDGLMLWREQGVGDEMMFASCYGDAINRSNGPVIIETDPRLVSLFARSFPEALVRTQSCGQVRGEADSVPTESGIPAAYTRQLPAGDLPGLFRRDLSSFSAQQLQWLRPDPDLVTLWGQRVAALPAGLRIGIGWRSQMMTDQRKAAYTTLEDWQPIFALPGIVLVNLQYGDVEAELLEAEGRFGITIHRWADLDLKDDFEAAAALTASLDLVIAPGTSTAELAGALGVPTWRLARLDWTCLGTGARPWYPAMQVIAPAAGQSIGDTLRRAADMLTRLLPSSDTSLPEPSQPAPAAEYGPEAEPALTAQRAAAERAVEEGLALHQAGQFGPAVKAYQRALDHEPGNAEATHFLGLVCLQTGDAARSVPLISDALRLRPTMAGAWNHLGLALRDLKRDAHARRCFQRALALNPGLVEGWSHLGLMHHHQDQLQTARTLHQRALRLEPMADTAQANLGQVAEIASDFKSAERHYKRAVALAPGSSGYLNNIAAIAKLTGNNQGAALAVRRAARLDPQFALARFNASLVDLEEGNLGEGWHDYAHRFAAPELQRPRRIALPLWQGEALEGRRLLVWAEQGLGDVLMFCTCLPDLRSFTRAGGSVVVELDQRLVDLFSRSFPWLRFRADTSNPAKGQIEQVGDCDMHIPMGGLPALFRTRISDFPTKAGYLRPDPVRVAGWRRLVDGLGTGLKVGIAWRSQLITSRRAASYSQLGDWGPILTMPGIIPVCLQYGDCDDEIASAEQTFGHIPHRWPGFDLKNHLDDVAALIANLDLVISPATAVTELAGAVGTPVWRLCHTDWTMLGTAARPWFPSMRTIEPRGRAGMGGGIDYAAQLLRSLIPQT